MGEERLLKAGIMFDIHPLDSHHYFGDSKYSVDPNFIAYIPVAPEVEQAVELAKPVWSKKSDVPLVRLDAGNHGYDRGLVIEQGICDSIKIDDKDYVRSELVVRISFGGKASEESATEKRFDYTALERLHISVYGGRQFFPEKPVLDEHGISQPLLEEVHVSFRWLRDKDEKLAYDDWSSLTEWYNLASSKSIRNKRFDERRTTYCRSQLGSLPSKRNSSESIEGNQLQSFMQSQDCREGKIRLSEINHPSHCNPAYSDIGHAILEHFGIGYIIPTAISYEGVRRVLYSLLPEVPFRESSFHSSDIFDKHLQEMIPSQGIEFLFGPVLAGIEKFVKS